MATMIFWAVVFWVCVWLTYREKRQKAEAIHKGEANWQAYLLSEHRRKNGT